MTILLFGQTSVGQMFIDLKAESQNVGLLLRNVGRKIGVMIFGQKPFGRQTFGQHCQWPVMHWPGSQNVNKSLF
jgi:hypothetical protein